MPLTVSVVQVLFAVSSLSAQFDGSRLSLRGSINSRLLPSASLHFPQRPPEP